MKGSRSTKTPYPPQKRNGNMKLGTRQQKMERRREALQKESYSFLRERRIGGLNEESGRDPRNTPTKRWTVRNRAQQGNHRILF